MVLICASTEGGTLRHKAWLPYGYAVTFTWTDIIQEDWQPCVPCITGPMTRARLLRAYQSARWNFMTEVAKLRSRSS